MTQEDYTMNKICTSVEQSKKLLSFGIDVNTADMYYKYVLPKSSKIHHVPDIGNPIKTLEWYNKGYTYSGKEPVVLNEFCIPAWSLSTLLDLLPKGHWCEFALVISEEAIYIAYDDVAKRIHENFDGETPIDAVIKAIEWFAKNGYLR